MTAFLENTPTQDKSLMRRLEQAEGGIDLYENADETENIWFNQGGDTSTLNVDSLKLVDNFTSQGSSFSSIKSDTYATSEGMGSYQ